MFDPAAAHALATYTPNTIIVAVSSAVLSAIVLFIAKKLLATSAFKWVLLGAFAATALNAGVLAPLGLFNSVINIAISSFTASLCVLTATMTTALRNIAASAGSKILAVGEKAFAPASLEDHFHAKWYNQPKALAFWEVNAAKQQWNLAVAAKLKAQEQYNEQKANFEVLAPHDDDYTSQKALLDALKGVLNRAATTLEYQRERYSSIKAIYSNACLGAIFAQNTGVEHFLRLNDAGSNAFHNTVKNTWGEFAYTVLKDLAARQYRGEIEERDVPVARSIEQPEALEDAPKPRSSTPSRGGRGGRGGRASSVGRGGR